MGEPGDELLEVALVDASNRIQISCTAVILRQVAKQAFSDVARAEHQEEALLTVCPRHKLGHEERYDHSCSCLNVLQGQIFGVSSSSRGKPRSFAGSLLHDLDYLVVSIIYSYSEVLGANAFRYTISSALGVYRRVFRAEIAGDEKFASDLLEGLRRKILVANHPP